MNVLFINNFYGDTSTGGAEEIVRIRAERYRDAGNHVYVLATCRDGEERVEENDQITVWYIAPKGRKWLKDIATYPLIKKLYWHIQNFFDIQTPKKIIALCREYQIDRVETHNIMGVSMQLPDMLYHAGIVHHHYLHDIQLVAPSGILPATHTTDSLIQKVYSACTRRVFRYTQVVYSPTEFLKTFYQSRGFFSKSEWRVENEQLFKNPNIHTTATGKKKKSPKKYLFVGYLGEHKGIPELLKAWKKRKVDMDATLTIVGDGHLRTMVETAANEDSTIEYIGRIPHDQLEIVYANHDVLLFTSQCIENRPNVIAEAMAYGLEIITVKTGGVEEMVEAYKDVTFTTFENFFIE